MSDTSPKERKIDKNNIAGAETRFATYCHPPSYGQPDLHVVKHVLHTKDGEQIPYIGLRYNYQRPYYITKKGMRNHKEKKESEKLEHVHRFVSSESQLTNNIKKALDIFGDNNRRKQLLRNPYIYGVDITSTAVLKHEEQLKAEVWGFNTPNTVACTDTETDVRFGTGEIVMQTISMKSRVFTCIKRSFFAGYSNVEERLQEALLKYLGDDVKERGIVWELKFVDTQAEIVMAVMEKAHEWKPDFLAIWNKEFDMKKMIEALKQADIDPAIVFSDPKVPMAYKHFEFILGAATRIKSDGSTMSLTPSQRWHVTKTPASFVVIDAMCAYRQIRTGEQEEPSYGLDYLMDINIERQKLKFDKADGYVKLAWHEFMQTYHPFEYVIYNVFDCVGMEMLDEKTTDLSIKISMFSGSTDYANFPSQPKRLCNEFHWHLLENGEVLGTTSDQMRDANDERTVDGKDWITMLPAHLVVDTGLRITKEFSTRSTARAHTWDLDIAGTYPTNGQVGNVSKSTTKREIIGIDGISENIKRRIGINLAGGHVNAVEICVDVFGAPTQDEMVEMFIRENRAA